MIRREAIAAGLCVWSGGRYDKGPRVVVLDEPVCGKPRASGSAYCADCGQRRHDSAATRRAREQTGEIALRALCVRRPLPRGSVQG